jgi:hypothetical protein
MDGFEHRRKFPLGIKVRSRRDAERTGERRSQIGENIRVQVGRHDGVESARFEGHTRSHGIDQHFVPSNIREVLRHLGRDFIPHDHAVALCVGFRHHGQQLARPRTGQLESKAHDTRHACAGVNGNFRSDFVGLTAMRAAALPGVFSLGIFAHDHPIEIFGRNCPQGTFNAGENPGRTHVGVLVEGLAKWRAAAPKV